MNKNYYSGILLAAGQSSRFQGRKLEAELADGRMLVEHSAERLAAHVSRIICVLHESDTVLIDTLRRNSYEVFILYGADKRQLSDSLRAAVSASINADGWLVALADMPFIPATVYQAVLAQAQNENCIIVPMHDGRAGHPRFFSKRFGADLLKLSGDEGARGLLATYANWT